MKLAGLPAIAPDEALFRNTVMEALNGACAGHAGLTAAIPEHRPAIPVWFHCRDGMAFAITHCAGEPAVSPGQTGTAQAAMLLDRAEPVLAAIEQALGIALEPVGLAPLPEIPARITVRIEAREEGDGASSTVRDRVWLALCPDTPLAPVRAPFAPACVGAVPVPVTLAIEGPRLAPDLAADLAPGDLVLLGPGPLAGQLHLPGRAPVAGMFAPGSHSFTPDLPVPSAQGNFVYPKQDASDE
ncbi:hypothetical protein [Novosphingobium beihaiensis]|uniref:Uncharacterized protein n=1 Tax=Novosphingobium beihaiensis TaxID=2930389 RepID=A0ABT0BVP5_9SPHN|nr:hypothetical protein [Novosphingobium beihaiensis]MCJ2189082.1 hypothetical protein [Novosphingobium beihaiensis]